MANPEHLAILKEGVEAWNWWRKHDPDIRPNLQGYDLSGMVLAGINLYSALLKGSNFCECKLHRADLRWAQLEGADLRRSNLNAANLSGTNLRQVNLQGAILQRANLTSANLRKARLTDSDFTFCRLSGARISRTPLRGANLAFAVLYETSFIDCDLSATSDLDQCRHMGPSTVDSRTLLKSRNLPLSFLRGCGLPDTLIESLPSWTTTNEFATCFISYSAKDQGFAERLHADLQDKGVRCWFAPHDIKGGKKINDQIDEAIRLYDRLLLILSDHSMASEWVKTEIANARQREIREKRQNALSDQPRAV